MGENRREWNSRVQIRKIHFSNGFDESRIFPLFNAILIGEPDEAIDGEDPGYDIVVDDESINNQPYGHDNPQIHQVQHIANVETLQQFSPPAYPVQPIYRPVIYNHGTNHLPYFKQNDEPAVRTANATDDEVKIAVSKEEAVEESKVSEKSEITLSTEQTEKVERLEQVLTTEAAKLEVVATTNLPAPMAEVLAVNATTKAN